jgi:hypothetical protein
MRGDPRVAPARLRLVVPAPISVTRLDDARARRRRRRAEQLEVIARMEAEERRLRRTGPDTPYGRRLL